MNIETIIQRNQPISKGSNVASLKCSNISGIMQFANRIILEVPIYLWLQKRTVEAAVGGCGNAANKASSPIKFSSEKQRNKGSVLSTGDNIRDNAYGQWLQLKILNTVLFIT